MRRTLCAAALLALVVMLGMVTPAGAATPRVSMGIYIKGAAEHTGIYDDYARSVDHAPAILHVYREFDETPFHPDTMQKFWSRGAVPLVSWEPQSDGQGYPLENIARGDADDRIRDAARAAKSFGHPIFLRWAQEANGNWFSWGRQPKAYVAAWRHMVRIFRAEGARNVRWVWSPFINKKGKFPLRPYFPGNRYVHWLGLDGFNWMTGWRSFEQVFGPSYRTLVRMSPRPIMIPEFGTYGSARRKAIWVKRTLNRAVPKMRHIRALVWWSDIHGAEDLRIHTVGPALRVLRAAFDTPRYNASRRNLLSVPARLR